MKWIVVTLLLTLLICESWGQETQLFPGENKLASCKVEIPLTYKKRDRVAYETGARENKDVKLVLLKYNEKIKSVTYSLYYIVVNNDTSDTFVYLETPEDHNLTSKKKRMLFVEFKVKYDRFYKADCFEQILEDNSDLRTIIKSIKATKGAGIN